MTAVTRAADARRSASIIRNSSMMWWSIGEHIDWTTNTSAPRTFSSICTRVSSLRNCVTSAGVSVKSRSWQISCARAGCEVPETIMAWPAVCLGGWRSSTGMIAGSFAHLPDFTGGHAHDQRVRGHVSRDHGARASHCAGAKCYGCNQQRIRPRRSIVADDGPALLPCLTVVVAGDGPSSNIDALTHLGVPGVTEVMDLCAPPYPGVLDFDVVAQLGSALHVGARPQVRERPNLDLVLQHRRLQHGFPDAAASANLRAVQPAAGADH